MNEQNPPHFPTASNAVMPTVLVIALSGLSYLVMTSSLESRRPRLGDASQHPPAPVGAPGLATTYSRLWQDPLESVHSQEIESQFGTMCIDGKNVSAAAHIRERVTSVLDAYPGKRVLCMPVLVPGGPYVESREQRRRTRCALLSALGDAGFSLVHPERMSFVKLRVDVQTGPGMSHRLEDIVVPVKTHYRSSIQTTVPNALQPSEYVAAIVLWVNESQLGAHPLSTMSQITEQLFSKIDDAGRPTEQKLHRYKRSIDIAMIGPSSSGTLLSIARNDRNWAARTDLSETLRTYPKTPIRL